MKKMYNFFIYILLKTENL